MQLATGLAFAIVVFCLFLRHREKMKVPAQLPWQVILVSVVFVPLAGNYDLAFTVLDKLVNQ